MLCKKILFPLLMTGLAAVTLGAQDVRVGVQAAVVFPSGDLGDGAGLGLQGGGHVRWAFAQGHGLMARADVTVFSDRNDAKSTSLAAAVDYTYHFDRNQQGFYVLAGLCVQDYHREFPDGTLNDNGLGLDLGVGYDLDRHFGVQARVTSQSASYSTTLTSLNLGVTYSF